MRIGFDISQTGTQKAGCGFVATNLIEHLTAIDSNNQYILYANFGPYVWDPAHATATFRTTKPNVSVQFDGFSHQQSQRFWQQPSANRDAQMGSPQIVHANNYFCPTDLQEAKLIYTLHDLAFTIYPELTTEANRIVCFDGAFQASLYADKIMAVSNYSRQHFLEIFPHYPAEQIHVLYPASRFQTNSPVEAVPNLPDDAFWLFVGTLEPRKNLRRLLAAYAELWRTGQTSFPMVIAGGQGWLEKDLSAYLDELGITDRVHLLGYVSDAQLYWLYQHCFAFVYPSLFEGFGLPVIEAMSAGAAVITSDVSSLPEVAGDAALLVNPQEVTSILSEMSRLLMDETVYRQCQERAVRRAARFSWDKTAVSLLQLYEELDGA